MPDLPTIDIFDTAATEDWRRENRLDPELLRRIRNGKLKQYWPDDAIRQLSPLAGAFCGTSLLLHERIESAVDGATKLLLRSHDGLLLETVILRIATGRTTLCVSSQIGCGAACDFCATGKMGLARNLSVREILEQVLIAGRELASEDRRIRNVVFMGMGEPFHNERNVTAAIELLTSPQYFDFAPTRLLVSSVGQCDGMLRFAGRFPRVNLAISLHSVRQETRERLIPLSRKFPLPALRHTIVEINRLQSCPVMVEYLMLDGQNDSIEDAALLAEWLRGLSVHLNLIPFNAIDDAPNLVASSPAAIRQFAEQMKELGITTTVRYSLGSDIAAACGQLVRKRIQSHPVTLTGLE